MMEQVEAVTCLASNGGEDPCVEMRNVAAQATGRERSIRHRRTGVLRAALLRNPVLYRHGAARARGGFIVS